MIRRANGVHGSVFEDAAILRTLLVAIPTILLVGGTIIVTGEAGIVFLYGLCFIVGIVLVAYHLPTVTVVAWALLGLYSRVLGGPISLPGGVDARPTDPLLLGMALALVYAALAGDDRVRRVFLGPCLLWSILIAWIGFQAVRSVPMSGLVGTLGELRSSYQVLFALPYVVVFFRTTEQQRRLFKALLLLACVFIVEAFIRGAFVHEFSISRHTRWIAFAQVNLALVLSVFGWYVARRTGFWVKASPLYMLILFATLILVIVSSHRSVWLASMGIVAGMLLVGLISPKTVLRLAIGLVAAGLAVDLLVPGVDLVEFVRMRMLALTSYQDDPTATWRTYVWAEAIQQARSNLFLGKGFGSYFYFALENGKIVTSIPHNLYVQLTLQLGLIGVTLYGAFLVGVLHNLWRGYRQARTVHAGVLSLYVLVALFGCSLFYVAYGLDPYTWLFVGLGLAAVLTDSDSVPSRELG